MDFPCYDELHCFWEERLCVLMGGQEGHVCSLMKIGLECCHMNMKESAGFLCSISRASRACFANEGNCVRLGRDV